jgi:tetratricopeptide (TPR) repeat protein
MRRPPIVLAVVFALLGVSAGRAVETSGRSWDDCLKAPDRDCVLNEAIDLAYLMDRTDRRAALIGSIAQTRAKAGEIDKAVALALQLPDRLLIRMTVLREIAAAQARAGRQKDAQAMFDAALQLAYGWKDALERGEVLYGIAAAQASAGMKAAAAISFDQALQAAEAVRIVGEKNRIVIPSPENKLARLLRPLAMHAADEGDIPRALQIARAIRYDVVTRVGTLLTLADVQMRAGTSPEAVLDEALVAARDPGSNMAQWPSFRDSGIIMKGSSANVRLLCDVGRAQARAGLMGDARASFDEALQTIIGAQSIAPSAGALVTSSADALADIADAQREAGLKNTAHETLYRAAMAADAITPDRARAVALARVAEMQSKAADAAPDNFARALAVARELDESERAWALQAIAGAEANAGLHDAAALIFAEAIALAPKNGNKNGRMFREIAGAQWRAGFIPEAAATFEQAFAATMADERRTPLDVGELIRRIAYNDRGSELVVASPALGVRLLEAAETVTERLARAELLAAIARALPN